MGVSGSSSTMVLSLTSELSFESTSEDSLAFSISSIELSEFPSTVALSLTSKLSSKSTPEGLLTLSDSSAAATGSRSTVALSLSPDPPPEAEQDTREPTEPILNPAIAIF